MLSMGLFPKAPVVFLREWKGKVEIIGSWGGVFFPCEGAGEVVARSGAFKYEGGGQELPESMSIIRFEPPSQDLVVRAPGQNDRWIIMTQQQQPAVTEQQQVEPVESQVGKWLEGQRQEQQEERQTEVKEQVESDENNDNLEDKAHEQKAKGDEQDVKKDAHQDGKGKQNEEVF